MKLAHRDHRALLVAIAIGLSLGVAGCQKDEAPPPMPAEASAEPVKADPLTIAPEDDVGTGDDDKPTGTGTGVRKGGLDKCCAALAGNAKVATSPLKEQLELASRTCQGYASQGKSLADLKGAIPVPLPAGCN